MARPLWETLNPDVVLGLVPLSPDQEAAVLSSGSGAVVPKYSNVAPQDETDFADGPRLQVEHLVQRGRRHLAFAGSNDPRIAELVQERRRRAEHAASDVGLDMLSETDVDSSTVADVVSAWLDAGIDGIVAYNDDIAALVAVRPFAAASTSRLTLPSSVTTTLPLPSCSYPPSHRSTSTTPGWGATWHTSRSARSTVHRHQKVALWRRRLSWHANQPELPERHPAPSGALGSPAMSG